VYERCHVDHFNDRRRFHEVRIDLPLAFPSAQEDQQWPESLTRCAQTIRREIPHFRLEGADLRSKQKFECRERTGVHREQRGKVTSGPFFEWNLRGPLHVRTLCGHLTNG
jgi:hypothetical protein